MNLVYNPIDAIMTLEETTVYALVLESPLLMRQFIESLDAQLIFDKGPFVLSDGQKTVALAKYLELIVNPFALDLNQRKILTKVHQELEQNAVREDMYQRTAEIRQLLHNYLQELLLTVDYPLEYNFDFSLGKLLAPVGVQFAPEDSLPGRVLQYIDLCSRLLGLKVFVLYQLSCILSADEMQCFIRDMQYRQIPIILLESAVPDSIPFTKILVVDDDLCIVRWEN